MKLPSSVFCKQCRKKVAPSFAVWDGVRLNFKCPECGNKNSQAGRFKDLLLEVH